MKTCAFNNFAFNYWPIYAPVKPGDQKLSHQSKFIFFNLITFVSPPGVLAGVPEQSGGMSNGGKGPDGRTP